MKKFTDIILLVFIMVFVAVSGAMSGDKGGFNGFTVYYDAEANRGMVYVNRNTSSALMVSYPESDQTFMYSRDGQALVSTEKVKAVMRLPESNIVESTVAVIISAEEYSRLITISKNKQ